MAEIISNDNRFYNQNGYELYMDTAFASLVLASTSGGGDVAKFKEFYQSYRAGYHTLALFLGNSTGIDNNLIANYLEGDGYDQMKHFIILTKDERTYRMMAPYRIEQASARMTSFQPIKAQKQLRSNARENLMKNVRKLMGNGYIDEFSFAANLFMLGSVVLGVTDLSVVEKMLRGEEYELPEREMPAEPKPEHRKQEPKEKVVVQQVGTPLEDMLKAAVSNMVAQVAVDDMVPRIKERIIDEFGIEPIKHVVIDVTGKHREIQGVVHEAFDSVCHFVQNNVPIMLYGPAGTGKGYLCEQIAEALGLDYYFMNSVTEEYKINGFIDVRGEYHESEFYKAFTKGGLFFLDEIDASAPEVLVCLNAAIANRYFTFPNGFKKAHENFRVVAAGNTLGTGADASYTGRMQLDAASLNRFVVVPVGYDERIDNLSAQGDQELVTFANAYRKAAKKIGLSTICSYRNISQIKVAEPAMELKDALLFCLTKEMNKDDINIMANEMSRNIGTNRYLEALRKVEPMV